MNTGGIMGKMNKHDRCTGLGWHVMWDSRGYFTAGY